MRAVTIIAPHFAEYSERLAAGFARLRPTVLVINSVNRAQQVARPIDSAARIVPIVMDRRHEQVSALIRSLAAVVTSRSQVVVVQEGVRLFLKPLVAILRRFTQVALIVHDPSPHSGSDSALAALHVPYRRWLRDHADVLIVHGDHCREELVALGYDRARIVTINHGALMLPRHAPAEVGEPGRMLMFGRMEAYKGLEVLLDAADRLTQRGVAFHLVVAGAGPEQQRLAVRMSAMPQVEVINRYLTPDELEQEIGRASFVVAPYLDATQSGVLASTLANGRPVIASDVGGLGDVIRPGVNGALVPGGDADALADAIGELLLDPARVAQLAAGARTSAAQELNWDVIAAGLSSELSQRGRAR